MFKNTFNIFWLSKLLLRKQFIQTKIFIFLIDVKKNGKYKNLFKNLYKIFYLALLTMLQFYCNILLKLALISLTKKEIFSYLLCFLRVL